MSCRDVISFFLVPSNQQTGSSPPCWLSTAAYSPSSKHYIPWYGHRSMTVDEYGCTCRWVVTFFFSVVRHPLVDQGPHTTFGRTPLDEWWARRRDLYLTTHNTHNRQISMLRRDSNPQSPADDRPPTEALCDHWDRRGAIISKTIQ